MTRITCSLLVVASLLTCASVALAQEPVAAPSILSQLKTYCVRAPYCPKVAPPAPSYCMQTTCEVYCKKVAPLCPSVCFDWSPSIYCKKCDPSFYPNDPCCRAPWHPAPCSAACECFAF